MKLLISKLMCDLILYDYFFLALAPWFLGKGAPVIQSSAARQGKPGQELFPPGIELGFSRTIRPRGSLLTTLVQCLGYSL
jgi:hypothetical protein